MWQRAGRFVARQHVTTKDWIIRRYLALREGDACTELRRGESVIADAESVGGIVGEEHAVRLHVRAAPRRVDDDVVDAGALEDVDRVAPEPVAALAQLVSGKDGQDVVLAAVR